MSRTTQKIHPERDEAALRTEQRRRREEGPRRTIHLHPEPMGDTAPTAAPDAPTVPNGRDVPPHDCQPLFWWVHCSIADSVPTYGEYVLMATAHYPHPKKGTSITLHDRRGGTVMLPAEDWVHSVVDDLVMQEPIRTYRQRAIAIALAQGTLTPRSAVEEMYALHTQDDARHAGVAA